MDDDRPPAADPLLCKSKLCRFHCYDPPLRELELSGIVSPQFLEIKAGFLKHLRFLLITLALSLGIFLERIH